MKILSTLLLILAFPSILSAADKKLVEDAKGATAILYSQDMQGGMRMHCTTTAFQKTPTGYLFVSAAHCLGDDDKQHEKVAPTKDKSFYITFDEKGEKRFRPATPIEVGYQSRGDDFAVLSVTTTETFPIIPLGDESKEDEGDDLINPASPVGLGVQIFKGSLTKRVLDRPVVHEASGINWTGAMLVQIEGVNGGSSGSALISENQKGIIGFLVGTIAGSNTIAIPVSKFVKFRKAISEDKYKWTRKNEETE